MSGEAGSIPARDASQSEDAAEDAVGDEADEGTADSGLACGYPGAGYGLGEGSALEPFELWTCGEDLRSLPELWCGNRATVLHFSVGWCFSCTESTYEVMRALGTLDEQDVALVEVLAEDSAHETATAEVCRSWELHFDQPVDVYIPPEGTIRGPLLRVLTAASLPLTVVLDRHGIVRLWSPAAVPADLADRIREIVHGA